MATGVVTARGLVSELVDCHAHDTVSAMSYRDRSVGHSAACTSLEASEHIERHKSPTKSGTAANIVVIATVVPFSIKSRDKALLVFIRIINFSGRGGYLAYFNFVIVVSTLTNVDGKSIRGGGKEGKC